MKTMKMEENMKNCKDDAKQGVSCDINECKSDKSRRNTGLKAGIIAAILAVIVAMGCILLNGNEDLSNYSWITAGNTYDSGYNEADVYDPYYDVAYGNEYYDQNSDYVWDEYSNYVDSMENGVVTEEYYESPTVSDDGCTNYDEIPTMPNEVIGEGDDASNINEGINGDIAGSNDECDPGDYYEPVCGNDPGDVVPGSGMGVTIPGDENDTNDVVGDDGP